MTAPTRRRSVVSRMYHGETDFNFVGNWRRWAVLSAVVIMIGLLSLGFRGLNFGIDFRGGTAWEVPDAAEVSEGEVREALAPLGLDNAVIQFLGTDLLRVQIGAGDDVGRDEVSEALADAVGVRANDVSVSEVGPSWGETITAKALRALVVFLALIFAYISIRLEWKMAIAAIVALAHDMIVTVGVYSLSGFEVSPATVVAFLTILGYSLYDTIVVFDKVQENTRALASSGRMTYSGMVNLSMNQVLMRSLNTSITALLPIASVLIVGVFVLGATTLQDFGLALFLGLLTGAYSSIFVAGPVLAALKEREPRYASVRHRLGGGDSLIEPGTAPRRRRGETGDASGTSDSEAPAGPADVGSPNAGSRPPSGAALRPRPRKKRRR